MPGMNIKHTGRINVRRNRSPENTAVYSNIVLYSISGTVTSGKWYEYLVH